MQEHYPFKLKKLSFEENALEPYLSEDTIKYHYQKLETYIKNLNQLLENHPAYHFWSLEKILTNIASFPEEIRQSVRNNAGGVFNHQLYFHMLQAPNDKSNSSNNFFWWKEVEKQFGSKENFQEAVIQNFMKVFGSGYTWVVLTQTGKIQIQNTINQNTVLEDNLFPLFTIDAWEHAYYLQYPNEKMEYAKNIFQILNDQAIEKRFLYYTKYLYQSTEHNTKT